MGDLLGRTHHLQGVLFEEKRLGAQVWKIFHMKISMMYFLASKASRSNTYNCVGVTFGCATDSVCCSCQYISETVIRGNPLAALVQCTNFFMFVSVFRLVSHTL